MKQAALGVLLVLVLVGAAVAYFLSTGPGDQSYTSPLDMKSQWICLAENEPHDFILTVREISKFKDGIFCPVCESKEISKAYPCQECGRHYPVGRFNASPKNCMHCGAELDGGYINSFHGNEGH